MGNISPSRQNPVSYKYQYIEANSKNIEIINRRQTLLFHETRKFDDQFSIIYYMIGAEDVIYFCTCDI